MYRIAAPVSILKSLFFQFFLACFIGRRYPTRETALKPVVLLCVVSIFVRSCLIPLGSYIYADDQAPNEGKIGSDGVRTPFVSGFEQITRHAKADIPGFPIFVVTRRASVPLCILFIHQKRRIRISIDWGDGGFTFNPNERPRWDSNPRMTDLQSVPLVHLGTRPGEGSSYLAYSLRAIAV